MKKFFDNFKKVFAFLLIIPMMFIFASCKKNNDNPNNPPTSSEQPAGGDDSSSGGDSSSGDEGNTGDGGSGGSETDSPEPEPEIDTFNLVVDYKLPDYLSGTLENCSLTPVVEDGYTLQVFTGTEYEDYFDGWYTSADYADNSKVETAKVFAEKDESLTVYAKWKTDDLEKYFCTAGVEFNYNKTQAIPISYSGTNPIVIISKYVKHNGSEYYVDSISANCFKDNKVIKEFRTSMIDFEVGANAFDNSTLEIIDFSKIKSIGNYGFKSSNIKQVMFSNVLDNFSSAIFYDCKYLESLDLSQVNSSKISAVPVDFCSGCIKLKTIDLPAQITTIKSSAFEGCSSLENLAFLDNSSITAVENRAFANCAKLENVEIKSKIVSYGTEVFSGSHVKNMTIYNMFYDSIYSDFKFSTKFGNLSSTLETLTFAGTGITKIYNNYLKNYSALKTVVMSNSITEIGNGAFDGCSNLENITFSTELYGDRLNISTLKNTKWYANIEAELQSDSLNQKIINNTLVYVSNTVSGEFVIGDAEYVVADIFGANENITSVTISKNVKDINRYTFYNSKVTSITVSSENTNFAVQSGELETFDAGTVNQDVTVHYSALYKLNDAGEKETLISYVADNSGGLFIVPNTVTMVYNSAFKSNVRPYFIYYNSSNATLNLVYREGKEEYGRYLIGNATISTYGNNSNCEIYKYFNKDPNNYDFTSESDFDFSGLSGKYFVIVEESDKLSGSSVIYSYYLVDVDAGKGKKIINIIDSIYLNFAI